MPVTSLADTLSVVAETRSDAHAFQDDTVDETGHTATASPGFRAVQDRRRPKTTERENRRRYRADHNNYG